MIMRSATLVLSVSLVWSTGCPSKNGEDGADPPASSAGPQEPAPQEPSPDEGLPEPADPGERPSMTAAECEGKGGQVVGDIGDGAIHKPDYRCEGGEAPLGSITAEPGGPIGVEGSVCCPKPG